MRFALLLYATLLACPTSLRAQDTVLVRSHAELAREGDSIRAAYRDSIALALRLGPAARLARAPRPPLEFRGHRLGDVRWLKKGCHKGKVKTKKMCEDPQRKIGNIDATVTYVFTNNRFGAMYMWFDPDDYEPLVKAFAAKFGRPDSVWTSEWQNRMGAKFENSHVGWVDTTGGLFLSRYGSRLTSGLGTMMSREEMEAMRLEEEAEIERAKKDL